MDPNVIQLFALDNGKWSWEVGFPDEALNQDGYAKSYAHARACIEGAIENAASDPERGPINTGVDTWVASLPPEGAVE